MNKLFDNAFESEEKKEEVDKTEDNSQVTPEMQSDMIDEIVVTEGSSEISPKQAKQNKPMSKLKQQREKEKNRKEKKKMEKKVKRARQVQNQQEQQRQKNMKHVEATKKEPKQKQFDVDNAMWEEAKLIAMDCWNAILGFEEIAVAAIMLPTQDGVNIAQEGLDMITTRTNVITQDIQNLKDRWNEVTAPMSGLEGKVEADQFPTFYLIYESILSLHQDTNTILTEPCADLSDMIEVVRGKVNDFIKAGEQK